MQSSDKTIYTYIERQRERVREIRKERDEQTNCFKMLPLN